MLVTAVEKTGNRKLGDVATTLVSQISCPTTCPLYHNGCYAERGRMGLHTMRLNDKEVVEGKTALDAAVEEAEAIGNLMTTRALRLHTVGDCATPEAAQIVGEAASGFRARGGGPVWTYTHASAVVPREAWGEDVSVLASVESLQEAHAAMDKGYAVAMVVEEHPTGGKAFVKDGIKHIPCPNQTHPGITCSSCKLCWDDSRLLTQRAIITFEAHGSGLRNVKEVIRRKSVNEEDNQDA